MTQGGATNVYEDFEGGAGLASALGAHSRSSVAATEGYGGSAQSYHIRSSTRGDLKNTVLSEFLNQVSLPLSPVPAASAQATVSAKARWLAGTPHLILNVHVGWLEASAPLETPPDLGTPPLRGDVDYGHGSILSPPSVHHSLNSVGTGQEGWTLELPERDISRGAKGAHPSARCSGRVRAAPRARAAAAG